MKPTKCRGSAKFSKNSTNQKPKTPFNYPNSAKTKSIKESTMSPNSKAPCKNSSPKSCNSKTSVTPPISKKSNSHNKNPQKNISKKSSSTK
jgi:hypothetical protein